MKTKERIDKILVDLKLAETRTQAQALIMAGNVYLDASFSHKVLKASEQVTLNQEIFIKAPLPYVSRGGIKLKGAIDGFKLDFKDKIILDVGASTGGFTDCALKHGAAKVYALDVGHALINEKLRTNPKVILMEEINFRYFDKSLLKDKIDTILVDVSFISLNLILPKVYEILGKNDEAVVLIKPQFEVGKGGTVKGIVKDPLKRDKVRDSIAQTAINIGFTIKGLIESPLKGDKGNIEYLLYLIK